MLDTAQHTHVKSLAHRCLWLALGDYSASEQGELFLARKTTHCETSRPFYIEYRNLRPGFKELAGPPRLPETASPLTLHF
jgi:hypothetical protein